MVCSFVKEYCYFRRESARVNVTAIVTFPFHSPPNKPKEVSLQKFQLLSRVETSVHSSNVAKMWQQRTWLPQWHSCFATNRFVVFFLFFFFFFFGKLQRDLPFTFGRLIVPVGGIFHVAMSTEYVLGIYTNIMVRCAFLPHLQPFATTSLAHLTFVAATLLPRLSCVCSSGPNFTKKYRFLAVNKTLRTEFKI